MLEAYKKREKYEMQKQASLIYAHADLIGASVARLFSNGGGMPSFESVFGYLFDDTNQQFPKEPEEQLDPVIENSKMRIMMAIEASKRNARKVGEFDG